MTIKDLILDAIAKAFVTVKDNIQPQIDTLNSKNANLAMRQLASSSYKASSTNYEYVNVTFTVPTGCTYLVWLTAVYTSGAPIGIALTTNSNAPSSANTVGFWEWSSSFTAGKTPVMMLVQGTYYMWAKRATVPTSANNHFAYGVKLYEA